MTAMSLVGGTEGRCIIGLGVLMSGVLRVRDWVLALGCRNLGLTRLILVVFDAVGARRRKQRVGKKSS